MTWGLYRGMVPKRPLEHSAKQKRLQVVSSGRTVQKTEIADKHHWFVTVALAPPHHQRNSPAKILSTTGPAKHKTTDSTSRHHTRRRTGISTQCGRQRGTQCVSYAVRGRRQAQQLQREQALSHGSARERLRHGASSALRAWCCPIVLPDHHQYEALAASPTRDPGTNLMAPGRA